VDDRESKSFSESIRSLCLKEDTTKLGTDESRCLKVLLAANCPNASLGVLKGASSSMIWTSPHGCQWIKIKGSCVIMELCFIALQNNR
jgi:hypothetical protein